MLCHDTGSTEAVHINTGTLELAQQIQRIADVMTEQNTGGNGKIVFELQVCNGRISRFLNFAGKWFPRKKRDR